ncbi:MAG: hypothetical protein H6Q58_934 [Firmicutes bacterium]|nr:hypothetical protein [Bacillota bacterium]
MRSLNICIDIDGTITDSYYWLDFCNEHFSTNITEADVTAHSMHEVLGVDEDEFLKFYERNKLKFHSNQKVREDAGPIIRGLSCYHNIYFVTARDEGLTMFTHGFLRKNEIPYDRLFVLGTPNKVQKAEAVKCDVFIEDSYDNAIQLSEAGYAVLLLDACYNRKPINGNITRVNTWNEINDIISGLAEENKAM